MLDLIVHVGFPKCASTTLQNMVFNKLDGYLGTSKTIPAELNFGSRFVQFTPAGPRITANFSQARKWTKQVMDYSQQHWPDVSRLILSHETLTNRNKLKERPLPAFLKEFHEDVWTQGKVKVIVVLRSQAEIFASSYAQVSISNSKASQNDFLHSLKNKLGRKNLPYLYHAWVKDFMDAVGKENVCVLFMEEIGQETFWDTLFEFIKAPLNSRSELRPTSNKYSKKKGDSQWQLRAYDPEMSAKTLTLNVFGLLWPGFVLRNVRKRVQNGITKVLQSTIYNARLNTFNQSERFITLDDEARGIILDAYRDENIKLQELLKKDLSGLGYV